MDTNWLYETEHGRSEQAINARETVDRVSRALAEEALAAGQVKKATMIEQVAGWLITAMKEGK